MPSTSQITARARRVKGQCFYLWLGASREPILPISPSGGAGELLGAATEDARGAGASPDKPTAAAVLPGTVIGIPPPPGEGCPIGVSPLSAIDEMPATVAIAPVADGRTLVVGKPPGVGAPMRVTPLGAIDEMPATVAMAPVDDGRTLALGKPPGVGAPIGVSPLGAIDEMPPTVAMAPVADGRTLAVGEPPGEGCPICVTLFEPTDEMRPTVGIAPLDSEERLAVDEACVPAPITRLLVSAPTSRCVSPIASRSCWPLCRVF